MSQEEDQHYLNKIYRITKEIGYFDPDELRSLLDKAYKELPERTYINFIDSFYAYSASCKNKKAMEIAREFGGYRGGVIESKATALHLASISAKPLSIRSNFIEGKNSIHGDGDGDDSKKKKTDKDS